jgi:membrane associated rhomboid family serine protease
MFLPISDAPNPKGRPYATIALIALNVIAFLLINVPLGTQAPDTNDPAFAEYVEFLSQFVGSRQELARVAQQVSAYDVFVFEHGFRPAAPSFFDLLFSMFLHGGLMHLAGNMLFLWIYGDNVEHRLGIPLFVVWYLATGAAATLFHAVFFAASDVPLVGASGAISGVLGFYFVWFPKNTVRVLVFLPPFFMQAFEVGARIVLGFYLLIDNVVPFLFASAGGVAHGAHIGGFLAGMVAAFAMNWRKVSSTPRDIDRSRAVPGGGDAIRQAVARGDFEEAASDFFALPASRSRGLLSPMEAVSTANWLRHNGRPDAAVVLLQRVIRGAGRAPGAAEASALAGLILLADLGQPSAAYQHLAAALRQGLEPQTEALVRQALADIESQQRFHPGPYRRNR